MMACFALLLLASVAALHAAEETPGQCYVCVSSDFETAEYVRKHHNNSVEMCNHFQAEDPRFIRTCQQPFRGCLTTRKGNEVTRQCSEDNLAECHNLNGMNYCYCQDPLCNGAPDDTYFELDTLSDDDDYSSPSEGSGGGSEEYTYSQEQTTEHTVDSHGISILPSMWFCVYAYFAGSIIR